MSADEIPIHTARDPDASQRVVGFDLETTGTDPSTDRIVEICLMAPGGRAKVWRVNPGLPIPAGATAVHGITDADVADAPLFEEIAPEVQRYVDGAILLGYNSRTFDTPLLHAELRRAGQPGIRMETVQEIDVMRIWKAMEPNSLSGAVRRWLGRPHEGAHSAREDVRATLEIWKAMSTAYGLRELDGVAMSKPENELDREGKFALDENGEVIFNFGKHKGKPVRAVDPGYLAWMSKDDFPSSTKAWVERLIVHSGDPPEAIEYRRRLAARSLQRER